MNITPTNLNSLKTTSNIFNAENNTTTTLWKYFQQTTDSSVPKLSKNHQFNNLSELPVEIIKEQNQESELLANNNGGDKVISITDWAKTCLKNFKTDTMLITYTKSKCQRFCDCIQTVSKQYTKIYENNKSTGFKIDISIMKCIFITTYTILLILQLSLMLSVQPFFVLLSISKGLNAIGDIVKYKFDLYYQNKPNIFSTYILKPITVGFKYLLKIPAKICMLTTVAPLIILKLSHSIYCKLFFILKRNLPFKLANILKPKELTENYSLLKSSLKLVAIIESGLLVFLLCTTPLLIAALVVIAGGIIIILSTYLVTRWKSTISLAIILAYSHIKPHAIFTTEIHQCFLDLKHKYCNNDDDSFGNNKFNILSYKNDCITCEEINFENDVCAIVSRSRNGTVMLRFYSIDTIFKIVFHNNSNGAPKDPMNPAQDIFILKNLHSNIDSFDDIKNGSILIDYNLLQVLNYCNSLS